MCSKKSMQVFCERKWIPFCRREPSLLSQRTQGFLLNNIPGAQKEWSNETCDQLEVSQSVGGGPTFQNGGLSTRNNGNCFLHLRVWTFHYSQYSYSYPSLNPSSIAGPTNHYYKRKRGLLLIFLICITYF